MNRTGFMPIIILLIIAVVLIACGIWYYETHKAPPAPTIISNSIQATSTTNFSGSISRGQTFQQNIGNGLVFELTPDDYGWDADIYPANRGVNDYGLAGIATPPYHGPYNALYIDGWDFADASNTAPNDGSVNAPQMERNFQFVTNETDAQTVSDAYNAFTESKTNDFSPDVPFGNGTITISNLKLGNLVEGSKAWIESMNFTVNLQFPTSTTASQPTSTSATKSNTAVAQTEGCALLPYTGSVPLSQAPYYTAGDPDFRGGMTCKFIINPNLPIFTFHFVGNNDNTLGNIQISEGTSTQIIQTIPIGDPGSYGISYDAIAPANYQSILVPVDANFDGYKDLPILNDCGGTGNCSYDFYLYNPSTNQFVENSFLTNNIATPTFDASKKQVTTSWNSSVADWEADTYQYENNQYVVVKKVISTWDRNNNVATIDTYQLQNGQMELTNSTTTPVF